MNIKTLTAAMILAVAGGAASAATVSVNAGDSICEGPDIMPGVSCSQNINELGENAGDTVFDLTGLSGAATINGFVRGQGPDLYSDTGTFDGNGSYRLSITLGDEQIDGDEFDADLFFDGNKVARVTDNNQSRSGVFVINGQSTFSIRAAGGRVADGSARYYSLNVAAVPLPAAGLLLLGGLGALGAARRRRKA